VFSDFRVLDRPRVISLDLGTPYLIRCYSQNGKEKEEAVKTMVLVSFDNECLVYTKALIRNFAKTAYW
jgi:hypothetical protein